MRFIIIMDKPEWFTSIKLPKYLFMGIALSNKEKLEIIEEWLKKYSTADEKNSII